MSPVGLFGRMGKPDKTDLVRIKVVVAGTAVTPDALYYLHTDQLATVHTITDKDQNVVCKRR